jgi:hypothetical protein
MKRVCCFQAWIPPRGLLALQGQVLLVLVVKCQLVQQTQLPSMQLCRGCLLEMLGAVPWTPDCWVLVGDLGGLAH